VKGGCQLSVVDKYTSAKHSVLERSSGAFLDGVCVGCFVLLLRMGYLVDLPFP
jgi:hypothetical protein